MKYLDIHMNFVMHLIAFLVVSNNFMVLEFIEKEFASIYNAQIR